MARIGDPPTHAGNHEDGGRDEISLSNLAGEPTQLAAHKADTNNPHEVDYSDVSGQDGSTDITAAELEELSDGSETTLHSHAGGDGATKEFFVSNHVKGTGTIDTTTWNFPVVRLPDAVAEASVDYGFMIPHDFTAMADGYPKFVCNAELAGDVRLAFTCASGGEGETQHNKTDQIAEATYTMEADVIKLIDVSAAFNALTLAAGDFVSMEANRDSDDVLDTMASYLYAYGLVVKYS